MSKFKLFFLVISLPLSMASYQAQAAHYNYNCQNYMISVNSHNIKYSPSGYISQADNLKFVDKVQVQDNIVSTNFGGVILRSDGTYDTTFVDGNNTPKTSKDRTYSDPYGNHKPIDLDIHNNIQVFGGGYSLFGLEYMNARWYFPSLRRFGSQDNLDVNNRFNLDAGNPIMNYDPSGHNALGVMKTILLWTTGVDASSAKSTGITAAIAVGSSLVVGGLVGLIVRKFMQDRAEVLLEIEINKIKNVAKDENFIKLNDLNNKANNRINEVEMNHKETINDFNELLKDYEVLDGKNGVLYDKLNSLNNENTDLTTRQVTVESINVKLNTENKQLSLKNENLKITNDFNKKKINDIEAVSIGHQVSVNVSNQRAGEEMMNIFNGQDETIKSLKTELKVKFNKSKTYKKQVADLKSQGDIIKGRNNDLEDLRKKMQKLTKRNNVLEGLYSSKTGIVSNSQFQS